MGVCDLSFEAWLEFTFGRPVRSDFFPWFDEREDFWNPPPALGVDYVTRLFEDSRRLLEPYDDRQIGGALWMLISEDCHFLYDRSVPAAARERCIGAIPTLFAELFEPRCAPVLGHIDEAGGGPLNSTCYMWWELFPAAALPDDPDKPRLDAKTVAVMEEVLKLGNPACQESAVHGLGHLVRYAPGGVDNALERFLARDGIRPELDAYARAARGGCIL